MIEAVLSLLISMLAFGIGSYMVYQISKDKEKWDNFWENENRQRPLAPKNWPGSDASKLLTYLFAFMLLFGGLLATFSSILNVIKYVK